jgi:hypothetical protein
MGLMRGLKALSEGVAGLLGKVKEWRDGVMDLPVGCIRSPSHLGNFSSLDLGPQCTSQDT